MATPSGRTELREMLSKEQIEANTRRIKKQLSKYFGFYGGGALLLNCTDGCSPWTT